MKDDFIPIQVAVDRYFVSVDELLFLFNKNRIKQLRLDKELRVLVRESDVKKHFKPRYQAGTGSQLAIGIVSGTVATVAGTAAYSTLQKSKPSFDLISIVGSVAWKIAKSLVTLLFGKKRKG